MVRLKSSALKHYVVNFADHAGRLAKMIWSNPPRNILIPLPSLSLYFVHPEFSVDDLEMRQFLTDIRNGNGDPIRFEMFHIPGPSDADCAQHYRDELKARGDVFEQVREAEKAYEIWEDKEKDVQYAAEQEPHGKLPGLISSQKGAYLGYHGVIYVYKDPVWKHEGEEQSVDDVEFDPALTADDYDLGELEMRGPQPPFKITWMSARRKSKVLRYEDQGVWLWFFDHRAWTGGIPPQLPLARLSTWDGRHGSKVKLRYARNTLIVSMTTPNTASDNYQDISALPLLLKESVPLPWPALLPPLILGAVR